MRICEKMVNRGLAEAHNQVSSARRRLRTFGQVVRETPGPVMASLVLGLIVLSYFELHGVTFASEDETEIIEIVVEKVLCMFKSIGLMILVTNYVFQIQVLY